MCPLNTEILSQLDLTDEQRSFIETSRTATTADMNQSRIISEFYFAKTLERVTNRMIKSNRRLTESNDRHARTMTWLTRALLFFAAVEAIATAVAALK